MRLPIIAGNWKMNKTIKEALELVNILKEEANKTDVEAVVCVPATCLSEVKKAIDGSKLKLGAQNMHWEESGAFTGEISPLMLNEIGVDYVIIGHSERRQYFNETDQTVNNKIKSAIKHNINPILCVGETLDERESGKEKDIVKAQIKEDLKDIKAEDAQKLVIAYEPIWAIGTGKTASSDDANEMAEFIRETIKEMYSEDVSENVRIQYGGSVKPANVTEIMNKLDIDGALVGGASLKSQDFIELINF
ncbi:triose-phosphate isomerase [Clostridiaceae bacterium M8S5]|nr:triose-phosphate isomerase [Clostridiaceae bacterium M8S5]